jgi:hypothetical protein
MAKHRKPGRSARATLAALPSLEIHSPSAIQLSNRLVQRASWNDPAEGATISAARSAKQVKGWRSFCPLRRLLERTNGASGITIEHVTAADLLRMQYDIASLGLSGKRAQWVYIDSNFLPSAGPTTAALAQTRAIRTVRRAMRIFTAEQQDLVHCIVLQNWPISRWQKERGIGSHGTATAKLVACLDLLVEHFDAEIERYGLAA